MIGTITPQFVLIFIILRVCCLFFYMRKINFVDDMRQVESCMKVFLQDYWFCPWFSPLLLLFCHNKGSVADKWENIVQFYTATSVERLKLTQVIAYEVIDFFNRNLLEFGINFLPPWQKSSGKTHLRLYDRICANINTNLPLFEKTVTCLKTLLES